MSIAREIRKMRLSEEPVSDPVTEREKANEIRGKTTDLLERLGTLMAEAQSQGLMLQWGGLSVDAYGRPIIPRVDVLKVM